MANLPQNFSYLGKTGEYTPISPEKFSQLRQSVQSLSSRDFTPVVPAMPRASSDPRLYSSPAEIIVGAPLKAIPKDTRDMTLDEKYIETRFLPADPAGKWAGATPSTVARTSPTGGQYAYDPASPGKIIKTDAQEGVIGQLKKAGIYSGGSFASGMYNIDHIIPKWLGGTDTPENLQYLSYSDHAKKTKIQAVALSLLSAEQTGAIPKGSFSVAQARMMAFNWKKRMDDSDIIPELKNGYVPLEAAQALQKKWAEDDKKPPKVGFVDVFKEMPLVLAGEGETSSVKEASRGLATGLVGLPYIPSDKATGLQKAAGTVSSFAGNIALWMAIVKTLGAAVPVVGEIAAKYKTGAALNKLLLSAPEATKTASTISTALAKIEKAGVPVLKAISPFKEKIARAIPWAFPKGKSWLDIASYGAKAGTASYLANWWGNTYKAYESDEFVKTVSTDLAKNMVRFMIYSKHLSPDKVPTNWILKRLPNLTVANSIDKWATGTFLGVMLDGKDFIDASKDGLIFAALGLLGDPKLYEKYRQSAASYWLRHLSMDIKTGKIPQWQGAIDLKMSKDVAEKTGFIGFHPKKIASGEYFNYISNFANGFLDGFKKFVSEKLPNDKFLLNILNKKGPFTSKEISYIKNAYQKVTDGGTDTGGLNNFQKQNIKNNLKAQSSQLDALLNMHGRSEPAQRGVIQKWFSDLFDIYTGDTPGTITSSQAAAAANKQYAQSTAGTRPMGPGDFDLGFSRTPTGRTAKPGQILYTPPPEGGAPTASAQPVTPEPPSPGTAPKGTTPGTAPGGAKLGTFIPGPSGSVLEGAVDIIGTVYEHLQKGGVAASISQKNEVDQNQLPYFGGGVAQPGAYSASGGIGNIEEKLKLLNSREEIEKAFKEGRILKDQNDKPIGYIIRDLSEISIEEINKKNVERAQQGLPLYNTEEILSLYVAAINPANPSGLDIYYLGNVGTQGRLEVFNAEFKKRPDIFVPYSAGNTEISNLMKEEGLNALMVRMQDLFGGLITTTPVEGLPPDVHSKFQITDSGIELSRTIKKELDDFYKKMEEALPSQVARDTKNQLVSEGLVSKEEASALEQAEKEESVGDWILKNVVEIQDTDPTDFPDSVYEMAGLPVPPKPVQGAQPPVSQPGTGPQVPAQAQTETPAVVPLPGAIAPSTAPTAPQGEAFEGEMAPSPMTYEDALTELPIRTGEDPFLALPAYVSKLPEEHQLSIYDSLATDIAEINTGIMEGLVGPEEVLLRDKLARAMEAIYSTFPEPLKEKILNNLIAKANEIENNVMGHPDTVLNREEYAPIVKDVLDGKKEIGYVSQEPETGSIATKEQGVSEPIEDEVETNIDKTNEAIEKREIVIEELGGDAETSEILENDFIVPEGSASIPLRRITSEGKKPIKDGDYARFNSDGILSGPAKRIGEEINKLLADGVPKDDKRITNLKNLYPKLNKTGIKAAAAKSKDFDDFINRYESIMSKVGVNPFEKENKKDQLQDLRHRFLQIKQEQKNGGETELYNVGIVSADKDGKKVMVSFGKVPIKEQFEPSSAMQEAIMSHPLGYENKKDGIRIVRINFPSGGDLGEKEKDLNETYGITDYPEIVPQIIKKLQAENVYILSAQDALLENLQGVYINPEVRKEILDIVNKNPEKYEVTDPKILEDMKKAGYSMNNDEFRIRQFINTDVLQWGPNMDMPTIMKRINLLDAKGLKKSTAIEGKTKIYMLNPALLKDYIEWLSPDIQADQKGYEELLRRSIFDGSEFSTRKTIEEENRLMGARDGKTVIKGVINVPGSVLGKGQRSSLDGLMIEFLKEKGVPIEDGVIYTFTDNIKIGKDKFTKVNDNYSELVVDNEHIRYYHRNPKDGNDFAKFTITLGGLIPNEPENREAINALASLAIPGAEKVVEATKKIFLEGALPKDTIDSIFGEGAFDSIDYEEIQKMYENGADTITILSRVNKFLSKYVKDDVIHNREIASASLIFIARPFVIDPITKKRRLPQDDEIFLSGDQIKALGNPEEVLVVKNPVVSVDGIRTLKVKNAERYGIENLGFEGFVVSPKIVATDFNADWDGDQASIYAVNAKGIPQPVADFFKKNYDLNQRTYGVKNLITGINTEKYPKLPASSLQVIEKLLISAMQGKKQLGGISNANTAYETLKYLATVNPRINEIFMNSTLSDKERRDRLSVALQAAVDSISSPAFSNMLPDDKTPLGAIFGKNPPEDIREIFSAVTQGLKLNRAVTDGIIPIVKVPGGWGPDGKETSNPLVYIDDYNSMVPNDEDAPVLRKIFSVFEGLSDQTKGVIQNERFMQGASDEYARKKFVESVPKPEMTAEAKKTVNGIHKLQKEKISAREEVRRNNDLSKKEKSRRDKEIKQKFKKEFRDLLDVAYDDATPETIEGISWYLTASNIGNEHYYQSGSTDKGSELDQWVNRMWNHMTPEHQKAYYGYRQEWFRNEIRGDGTQPDAPIVPETPPPMTPPSTPPITPPTSPATPTKGRPTVNIPQNLVSGVESFGVKQEANSEAKKLLGDSPHSIDMIGAGLRTRTTRSVGEMQKYNVKVGDVVTQFGKSADGTTKQILTKITAIHPKGTPGFLDTWYKEGWTQDGITEIERFKDGAAAIEFEIFKPSTPPTSPLKPVSQDPGTSPSVSRQDNITRETLRKNPDKQYLFGDNLTGSGFGGQAKEMRGEPNAIGIPTKKSPSMDESAFFTDKEFSENKKAIDTAFKKIDLNKEIVIPEAGLGTGRAQLEERAPKTFEYLQEKINTLFPDLTNSVKMSKFKKFDNLRSSIKNTETRPPTTPPTTTGSLVKNNDPISKIIENNPVGSIIKIDFAIGGGITSTVRIDSITPFTQVITQGENPAPDSISLDATNLKSGKKYSFIVDQNGGVIETLGDKNNKIFIGGDNKIVFNKGEEKTDGTSEGTDLLVEDIEV